MLVEDRRRHIELGHVYPVEIETPHLPRLLRETAFHIGKDLNVAFLPLGQLGKQLAHARIVVQPGGLAVEPGRVALHLFSDFQDFEGSQFASHRSYIQDRERPVQICPLAEDRVKCRWTWTRSSENWP